MAVAVGSKRKIESEAPSAAPPPEEKRRGDLLTRTKALAEELLSNPSGFACEELGEDVAVYTHISTGELFVEKKVRDHEFEVMQYLASQKIDGISRIAQCQVGEDGYILFSPYYGQTLQEMLEDGKRFSLEEVRHIGEKVLTILNKLHSLGIIYGDLKTTNVCYDPITKQVTLIDFGLTYSIEEVYDDVLIQSTSHRDIRRIFECPLSTQNDVWSLGCLMHDLYAHRLLFPYSNIDDDGPKDLLFQAHMIEHKLGKFPAELITSASRKQKKKLLRPGKIDKITGTLKPLSAEKFSAYRRIIEAEPTRADAKLLLAAPLKGDSERDVLQLAQVISSCVRYSLDGPEARPSPTELLEMDFFHPERFLLKAE
jgi:serine/threonine protein kinase